MSNAVQESMNAVVLHEYGGPDHLIYETAPLPEPEPDEILVRIAAASVNPVDWKLRSGSIKERMPLELPAILGRDVAGTVAAVGHDVCDFQRGDRVLGFVSHGYAEMIAGAATDFARIPPEMTFMTAAALPLVMLTGEQLVLEAAAVKPGQTILIIGALGGVGRSAVHAALKAGCCVYAGVRTEQKNKAMELGVAAVVCLDDDEDIKRLGPYDVVADTVGQETGQKLVAQVARDGVFASVVGKPANAEQRPDVRFAGMMAHPDPVALARLTRDVQAGEFEIPVGRHFPLKDAAVAHETAEKGGIGKVLLIP